MAVNSSVSFSTKSQTECLLMPLCAGLYLLHLCGSDQNVNVSGFEAVRGDMKYVGLALAPHTECSTKENEMPSS